MNELNSTPPPWKVKKQYIGSQTVYSVHGENDNVQEAIDNYGKFNDIAIANQLLILAAPEMLAVLIEIATTGNLQQDKIIKVIEKATGKKIKE